MNGDRLFNYLTREMADRTAHYRFTVDRRENQLMGDKLLEVKMKDAAWQLAKAVVDKNPDIFQKITDYISTPQHCDAYEGSLLVISTSALADMCRKAYADGRFLGDCEGVKKGKKIGRKRHPVIGKRKAI